MKFGSLFTGIGGLDLGLVWAGFDYPLWQVEIDPWCRGLLNVRFPGVRRYGDVRTVDPAELAPVDLVCGGFPCQPVSNAGRRKAQADERWLWPEFARIVRVLRPRYVLVENVAALLYRGFDDVQTDLAALGYDTEWDCIPASAVGAPHERDRVWLLAYAPSAGRGRAGRAATGEAARRRSRAVAARLGALADSSSLGLARTGGARDGRTGSANGGDVAHADSSSLLARRRRGRAGEAGELADAEDDGRRSGRTGRSPADGAGEQEQAFLADAGGDGHARSASGNVDEIGAPSGPRGEVAYPDGGRLAPKDEDVRAWERDLGRRGVVAYSDLERLEERGVRAAARRAALPDAPGRGGRGAASMADTYFAGSQGHRRLRERAREQLAWADGEAIEGGRLAPPGIRRVAHGIPHRVDRLRALGNAVVPQLVAYVVERIAEHEARDG